MLAGGGGEGMKDGSPAYLDIFAVLSPLPLHCVAIKCQDVEKFYLATFNLFWEDISYFLLGVVDMSGWVFCFIFRLPMNPHCLPLVPLHYVCNSPKQAAPSPLNCSPSMHAWALWHPLPASLVWTLAYIFYLPEVFWTISPAPSPLYHSLYCSEFLFHFYNFGVGRRRKYMHVVNSPNVTGNLTLVFYGLSIEY